MITTPSGDEIDVSTIPFDEKMVVIRSYASAFWIVQDIYDGRFLEGRLDHQGYTIFVGYGVYVDEIVNAVYEHLYEEIHMYTDSW